MTETPTYRDSFLAWNVILLIGANGSWLNVLDQHYCDFANPGHPIGENGKIDQLLLRQARWQEMD